MSSQSLWDLRQMMHDTIKKHFENPNSNNKNFTKTNPSKKKKANREKNVTIKKSNGFV